MLALLYDIHGNLPALEAVLADAHDQGSDTFLLGGDYAALGAWPSQTVACLDDLRDARWIRGNWERWLGEPSAIPEHGPPPGAAEAAIAELGPEAVARLAALPETLSLYGVLFCHASPRSDMDFFLTEQDPSDDELLEGTSERRVVFGHTHLQFTRTTASGVELVNPGSVGLPFDGDQRAAYALFHPDRHIELRRVEYDVERSIAALRKRGEPWADSIARTLERASL